MLQPTLTLQNSLLTRFPETGGVSVSVQASNGRSMVQDTRTVQVYGNTVKFDGSKQQQKLTVGVKLEEEKLKEERVFLLTGFLWVFFVCLFE